MKHGKLDPYKNQSPYHGSAVFKKHSPAKGSGGMDPKDYTGTRKQK